jgi:hypothetical protein
MEIPHTPAKPGVIRRSRVHASVEMAAMKPGNVYRNSLRNYDFRRYPLLRPVALAFPANYASRFLTSSFEICHERHRNLMLTAAAAPKQVRHAVPSMARHWKSYHHRRIAVNDDFEIVELGTASEETRAVGNGPHDNEAGLGHIPDTDD